MDLKVYFIPFEIETKFITGLYLWRDYINNLGGLCNHGLTFSDLGCDEGKSYICFNLT